MAINDSAKLAITLAKVKAEQLEKEIDLDRHEPRDFKNECESIISMLNSAIYELGRSDT